MGHLGHPEPELADLVLEALAAGGPVPVGQQDVVREALAAEAERLSRVLAALEVLEGQPGVEHVVRGLADEVARAAHRAVGLLCLMHEPTAIVRTVGQLGAGDGNRGLALESLEVTVGRGAFPQVVALVDPTLVAGERRARLSADGPPRVADDAELLLVEIVEDPLEHWGDRWLRACALHALVAVAPSRARREAWRFSRAPDPVTAETAAWVLATVPDDEPAPGATLR
jgi:hypothetical protein